MRSAQLTFLGTVLLLLFACGGGGGSGSSSGKNGSISSSVGPISDSDFALNSVSEYAEVGTLVGVTATAVDEDEGDTVSYSMIDDAGGRFAIDAASGVVTVAGELDFETESSHSIYVGAESSDGSSRSAVFDIQIEDEVTEPLLTLSFPVSDRSAVVQYTGTEIDVAGTVSEPSGELVRVDISSGSTTTAAAIDVDGNWRAVNVPIVQDGAPSVELKIEAFNESGRWAKLITKLSTEPLLDTPIALDVDPNDGRAFVLDFGLKALIALDLATDERQLISSGTRGSGPSLFGSQALVVDTASDRAFVEDGSGFLAIDLSTGDRTVFSPSSLDYGPMPASTVRDMVLDKNRNRLILGSHNEFLTLDLTTGVRDVLSDATHGTGLLVGFPYSLAMADNDRFLVSTFTSGLNSIDLNTGDRTFFSVNPGPAPQEDSAIAYDPVGHRILAVSVAAYGYDSIQAFDLSSGERTDYSPAGVGSDDSFRNPQDIAWDGVNDRAIVADYSTLVGVDAKSGSRVTISDNEVGRGRRWKQSHFLHPYSNKRRTVYVEESVWLSQVDLDTGERSFLFNYSKGDGPVSSFNEIMAFGPDEETLFIRVSTGILAIHLESGDRAIVSDYGLIFGPSISRVTDMVVAPSGDRLFAADSGSTPAVLAIDLGTGLRTVFSGPSNGVGPDFQGVFGIALDAAANRLLVPDFGMDALIAVDLSTGDRSIVADYSATSSIPLYYIKRIDFDAESRRLFALNEDRDALGVYELDLVTGQSDEVSGPNVGTGVEFDQPTDLFADPALNRAVVVHKNGTEVLIVDLTSGDRVVVAR